MNYQPQETRSRLSKTVDRVLRDPVAIPHYLHFMELHGADHLVRFWLEAESFRSTSWSRIRAHSLNSVKHSSLAEPVPASAGGSEPPELILHTPDSAAVESERGDQSAGTPSRQTPSKTGTPSKVQSSSSLRDLSDKLMKSECVCV